MLTAAALSCGVWILDWAYSGGGDPEPDVSAIVEGLVQLVEEIGDEGEDLVIDDGGPVIEEEESEESDFESVYDAYEDDEYEDDEYEDDEYEDDAYEDEPEDEEEYEDDEAEPEPEPEAEPEPEPEPVPEIELTHKLWTPAPEVPTTRSMSRVQRESQMEAQIDQIMGSFNSDAAAAADADAAPRSSVRTVFDDVALPDLAVIDEADAAVPEPDPVFEPEPDEAPEEPEGEQIPGPRLVR